MGVVCSHNYVPVGKSLESRSRSTSSNASSTQTTTTMKTIQSASIFKPDNKEHTSENAVTAWTPFQISRREAEELLCNSDAGSFVFSHDLASELFISLSVGSYVCHHAVMSRDHSYYVGTIKFASIGDVIDYYRDHPLGNTKLKEEYRRPPAVTSSVQMKPHPDFSISSSSTMRSSSENSTSESDVRKNTITCTNSTNHVNGTDLSPDCPRVQPHRPSRIEEESDDTNSEMEPLIKDKNNVNNKMGTLGVPKNNARRMLQRTEAIDGQETDTSGVDQELPSCISPLLPRSEKLKRHGEDDNNEDNNDDNNEDHDNINNVSDETQAKS